jgi:hypothetical protein
MDAGPVIEFADALVAIIRGEYPAAPDRRFWYFGRPDGVTTL